MLYFNDELDNLHMFDFCDKLIIFLGILFVVQQN
jgi:hypothetical protein